MKKPAFHTWILIGLAIGVAAGLAANLAVGRWPGLQEELDWLLKYVTGPIGRIFLNLLFMTVVPVVFVTLTLGVTNLGDLRRLGRIGMKTLACFLMLTALSTVLGMGMVSIFQPGKGFDPATQERLLTTYRGEMDQKAQSFQERGGFGVETFLRIIPRNPIQAMVDMDMLAVIFFALMLGAGLTKVHEEKRRQVASLLDTISEALINVVGFAIKLAPLAVPCLIFNVVSQFGLDLLEKLLFYVIIVFAGYLIFLLLVYPVLIKLLARANPFTFLRRAVPIMVTGFSTSSSNATLPTTIKIAEEDIGVPSDIAGFVLPLGATMNMNGTALFEGVTVLFLAQVFGIELTLLQQLIVVVLAVLMAIGTAGVPGASIPMIMIVLRAVNVPPEGIAIILGMDRIMDMGRTVLNVTGDVVTASIVTRMEGGAILTRPPAGE